MSLQIFLAHTGTCLTADPISFTSIDNVKLWIARNSSIKPPRQILMTARGKQVKLQTLLTESEIFVYDRDLIAPPASHASKADVQAILIPPAYVPQDPPKILGSDCTLEEWQLLFKKRRAWSIEVSKACGDMVKDARKYDREARVIQRATAIAVENIKQHVGTLHQKHEEAKSWTRDALNDHTALLDSWEGSFQRLSSIRAMAGFIPLLKRSGNPELYGNEPEGQASLQDFVDKEQIKEAAFHGKEVSQRLADRMSELTLAYNDVVRDSTDLTDNFNHAFVSLADEFTESSVGLIEETEAIARKVSSDYENNLGLPNTQKSITAISKTALLHTRNFIPSLIEIVAEIDQFFRATIERKNSVMDSALSYMQRISTIESILATIQPNLANLDISTEDGVSFDIVSFVDILPTVYGSLLIESVRRYEWSDRITTESSTLAEEMAVQKEEEERRRKRWLKTVGEYLKPEALDNNVIGIEVNLKSNEQRWPNTSRDDISQYFKDLNRLGGFNATISDLKEMMKSFDTSSNKQTRKPNTFRNGSMHDAAFGRTSMLGRGDDDLLRSLESDKSKLENRLKGSESRVRKLEDLLHRQSQITRPQVAGLELRAVSPVLHQVPPSPKAQDNLSRRSSVSSRRFSANNGPEEKALAQKIFRLEADLSAEKAKSLKLQDSAAGQSKLHEKLQNQVHEASSTKKDLMDNFEAQKHEFDDERRLLEDENMKLKLRLEELEEEMDRVQGSHDDAKISIDKRAAALDMEIERIRKEASEEVEKAQGQIDFLKHDYTMQREKANQLEQQVQKQTEEKVGLDARISTLRSVIQNRDDVQADHQTALRAAHLRLAVDEPVPDDFNALVEAIEVIAEKAASRLQETRQALETMRTDHALLDARSKQKEEEIKSLVDAREIDGKKLHSTYEDLREVTSRIASLQSELHDEREELEVLRSKFAVGETGSEALRNRVAAEEQKAYELSDQLATHKAQMEQLQIDLADKSMHVKSLQTSRNTLERRHGARARRAEDLSNRLYLQTHRLSKLLEQVGFTVTKQVDGMTLQRAPKTASASTTLTDQSQFLNRSMSVPLPTKDEQMLPDHLHWALVDDSNSEAQFFNTFVEEIQTFDVDVFSEAIIKRVKEAEHLARKWQREAKAYREKSHRAQIEAHEKIAYRSFKEGDMALFLPTRNQATRPWAAFNVGAPHYFLREQDSHRLLTRDWLLARISKVEERVVDLSKSINGLHLPREQRRLSITSISDGGASFDDENPFELSDGLRWYLLDAAEEKPGAPTTPGLGKSTVASAKVDARGSIQHKKISDESGATKTLTKSLDSRRSSSNSKKSLIGVAANPVTQSKAAMIEDRASTHSDAQGHADPTKESPVDTAEGITPSATSPSKLLSTVAQAQLPVGPSKSPTRSSRTSSPQKSPEKPKPRAWDSLWSLDLSLESKTIRK